MGSLLERDADEERFLWPTIEIECGGFCGRRAGAYVLDGVRAGAVGLCGLFAMPLSGVSVSLAGIGFAFPLPLRVLGFGTTLVIAVRPSNEEKGVVWLVLS